MVECELVVEIGREIIVGRNSTVWRRLAQRSDIAARFYIALSHRDLDDVRLLPSDRVWILSYSRKAEENAALIHKLGRAGVAEYVYISSATTNVVSQTRCYHYPTVKLLAETLAREKLGARILTVGVMFDQQSELPAGATIATSYDDLADFMLAPQWPDSTEQSALLFRPCERPFRGNLEEIAFTLYGRAISMLRRWPCALRPVDFILRAMGYKWYGYLYLSNRTWFTTTS
ncbi:hypothetical protein [Bradyrhizobium ottawaense]|uniref:hypothetical protein n=1 Tax=Bradyrhizobium ottawaense TaxID=931866 RepID=UPI0027D593E5|nr:hypothetical protein BwSH14_03290 [Bradyrhizobium ottawaense]GMO70904.1 hypothetical protein BwSH17_28210 [Bradyrhizobium ottawaense]